MKVLVKPKVNKNHKDIINTIYAYEDCQIYGCISQAVFPCNCIFQIKGPKDL
jgi:hypothetical protein